MHPVATQLNALAKELNASFLEREDVIESMLLALLAGEHHFQIGVPGVAKSAIVRQIVSALDGARYFEIQLSKTRPAEAVLGPLNIKAFRESGDYKLKRAGYATDVDLLFLDEVGKASPVTGHDLLALLNERVYHEVNGGRSVHQAPLHTAFTASNEMITSQSDDAAALWDRLLVRVVVDSLESRTSFARLLTLDIDPVTTRIDFAELAAAAHGDVPAIGLDAEAIKAVVGLRTKLAAEHIYPSDRRWRQSVKVLKAAAFLRGADVVADDDLAALRFTLWDTPEQVERVAELCHATANPFAEPVSRLRSGLREIAESLDARVHAGAVERAEYGKEANQKLLAVRKELDSVLDEADDRAIPGFKAASDAHLDLTRRIFADFLETPPDVMEAVIRTRAGKGDGGNR